jgi:hypothetical protein
MRGHMATPKPGEIRCPTCHRSTPPAAFCTQCGSAIPSDARIRPRGMDRDELQDRIRQRRSGGDPYRRGTPADERVGYERFEPDPMDASATRSVPTGERRADHFDDAAASAAAAGPDEGDAASWPAEDRPPDITRDRDDWARPAAAATAASLPPDDVAAPPPSDIPMGDDEPGAHAQAPYDDAAYGDDAYAYGYEEWREPERESSGAGMFAILGFLALGLLALGAGAVLAGVFGSAGVGEAPSPSPSSTPVVTVAPSPTDSAPPSTSSVPSGSPDASGGPVTFPDGFTAEAQPCFPGSVGRDGCDSNGVSNSGAVDIWVGFTNGNARDVIGALLEAPDGTTVDQSIDLTRIGCGRSCNGYTWFSFSNLEPGTYAVRITRNGEPASETTFEVT